MKEIIINFIWLTGMALIIGISIALIIGYSLPVNNCNCTIG